MIERKKTDDNIYSTFDSNNNESLLNCVFLRDYNSVIKTKKNV